MLCVSTGCLYDCGGAGDLMGGSDGNATSNHITEEAKNKNEDQRRKGANEDIFSSSLSTTN
eukprot:11384230-Ditylum_brightwellii.AAC.1